jgi:hypothetical protein
MRKLAEGTKDPQAQRSMMLLDKLADGAARIAAVPPEQHLI